MTVAAARWHPPFAARTDAGRSHSIHPSRGDGGQPAWPPVTADRRFFQPPSQRQPAARTPPHYAWMNRKKMTDDPQRGTLCNAPADNADYPHTIWCCTCKKK